METDMTYQQWKVIHRRKQMRKIRRFVRKMLPQKLWGVGMLILAIAWIIVEKELAVFFVLAAMGICMVFARRRIIY